MSGLAMCSSGPQGQTKPLKAAKGRANSELRNVAPAEGGRPLKKLLADIKKGLSEWTALCYFIVVYFQP